MAKLDELMKNIPNAGLKAQIEAEVAALKNQIRFGLVYERHLPETVIVGELSRFAICVCREPIVGLPPPVAQTHERGMALPIGNIYILHV